VTTEEMTTKEALHWEPERLSTSSLITTHAPRVFALFADGTCTLPQALERLCGPSGSARMKALAEAALLLHLEEVQSKRAATEELQATCKRLVESSTSHRTAERLLDIWSDYGKRYSPQLTRVLGQLMPALGDQAAKLDVYLDETDDNTESRKPTGVVIVSTRIGMAQLRFRFIPRSCFGNQYDVWTHWMLELTITDRRTESDCVKRYTYELPHGNELSAEDVEELARNFRSSHDPVLDPRRVLFADHGDQTSATCTDLRRRLAETPMGGVIRRHLETGVGRLCHLEEATVLLAESLGAAMAQSAKDLLARGSVLDLKALTGIVPAIQGDKLPYDVRNL
jgi:hypothetical protein